MGDDSNFIFGTLVCSPEYICGLECLQSPQDLSAEKECKNTCPTIFPTFSFCCVLQNQGKYLEKKKKGEK